MKHEQSRSVCIFIGSYILLSVLLLCDCDLLPVQCTSKMFALIDFIRLLLVLAMAQILRYGTRSLDGPAASVEV